MLSVPGSCCTADRLGRGAKFMRSRTNAVPVNSGRAVVTTLALAMRGNPPASRPARSQRTSMRPPGCSITIRSQIGASRGSRFARRRCRGCCTPPARGRAGQRMRRMTRRGREIAGGDSAAVARRREHHNLGQHGAGDVAQAHQRAALRRSARCARATPCRRRVPACSRVRSCRRPAAASITIGIGEVDAGHGQCRRRRRRAAGRQQPPRLAACGIEKAQQDRCARYRARRRARSRPGR